MQQTTVDETLNTFMVILNRHLKFGDDASAIPMEQRLDELGLDSMSAVNLLLDLEDGFDMSFPDALLTEETFRTGTTLYNAVRTALTGSAA